MRHEEHLIPRAVEETVRRRLATEPVIILHGPRTVGKSTLLRRLADDLGTSVIDLDDLGTRSAVTGDPAFFASAPSPVLVDEFQHALELLDAIKSELNRDLRPGRFVLTGSTRYLTLPQTAQALTGRVHVMTVWPLSQPELEGHAGSFLARLVSDPATLVEASPSKGTWDSHAVRVLAGGFPLALRRRAGPERARWLTDYVTLAVERDVMDLRRIRQREIIPRLLRRLASQTGQVLNVSEAARQVGIDNTVAEDYTTLLEAVFLVHRLPAWGRTLRSRVGALPKVHMFDTGLGAHLLGLTLERLGSRDPAALTEYGHLLETFVVNEVLKQASWSDESFRFGHFRTHDSDEVDLVIERGDGLVSALEVKASSRVVGDDLKGLRILRDRLGSRFASGAILYSGARGYSPEDRIHVVPIDRLWS